MKKKFNVTGMMCSGCQASVEKRMARLDGVESADVSLENKSMVVEFNEDKVGVEDIIHSVEDAGFEAELLD